MKLAFRKAGEGPPLIILHGLFGSGDNWLTVSKPLAEHFTIYVLDQRNHGKSPHENEHSYAAMAEDIIHFIREHHLVEPHLLGHSMGGKTAMHVALNFPEKINKLIVADISPRYYTPHHQDVIAGLKAVNLAALVTREQADELMKPHLSEAGVRQFLLKNLYRTEAGGFAWRMNLDLIIDQIENIGEESKGVPFTKPALFIKGELSRYITEKDEPLIRSLFPVSNIVTIKNAGHWVQAEKPAQFVNEVLNFLK